MLEELIRTLRPEIRRALEDKVLASGKSLPERLISDGLQGVSLAKEDVCGRYQISASSYFKNHTLAVKRVEEIIMHTLPNPFDELILLRYLYNRGLNVLGGKLSAKLEASYQKSGHYFVLDALYHEELLQAYTRADLKGMNQLKNKMLANSEQLHQFNQLNLELVTYMLRLEQTRIADAEFEAIELDLRQLYQKSTAFGHSALVAYSYYNLSYLFANHTLEIEKGWKLLEAMAQHHTGAASSELEITSLGVDRLVFLATYADYGNPTEGFGILTKAQLYGQQLISKVIFAQCLFYLTERDFESAKSAAEALGGQVHNPVLLHYGTAARAFLAYLVADLAEFRRCFDAFYECERPPDSREPEMMLRYLEVVLLLQYGENEVATARAEAALQFLSRNFNQKRTNLERPILRAILKRAAAPNATRPAETDTPYRFGRFVLRQLSLRP